MRIVIAIVVAISFAGQTSAQEADALAENGFGTNGIATRRVRNLLAQNIRPEDWFKGKEKFKDVIDLLSSKFLKKIPILVDDAAFVKAGHEGSVLDDEVSLPAIPGEISLSVALREVISQVGKSRATVLVRPGRIDIVPVEFATTKHLLKQTVELAIQERKLVEALQELAAMTSVSIVLDTRAKKNGQTLVTAQFNNDVKLRDAVRMLAEMAELKAVYLESGVFITTPDHAIVMEKELREAKKAPAVKTTSP